MRRRPDRRRAAVVHRPGARRRAEASRTEELASRRGSASRSSRGQDVDDCQQAPNPILPATNEIIWGALLRDAARRSVEVRLPGRQARAWTPAPSGSGATSTRPSTAKAEAEQILAEYQRQLADARNEADRIIEEARQTADALRRDLDARGPRPRSPRCAQRAAADIEAAKAQALADLRAEVATLAIGAAEKVVERNLDRDTNVAAHRELHQPGRAAAADEPTIAIRCLRRGFFGSPGPRATLDEVEDELFRFARALEGNDELRDGAHRPARSRRSRRQEIVEELLGGKASHDHRGAGLDGGRHRPRPRPAGHRRHARRA